MVSSIPMQSIVIPILFILAIVLVVLGFWRNWIQWIFLCEVQWFGTLFLLALPISALTIERALVLGAYELRDTKIDSVTIGPSALASGFYVALAVGLCAISIIWTAQLEFNLGEERLQEKLPLGPPSWVMWLGGLLVATGVLINLAVTHYVSVSPSGFFSWAPVDAGLILGSLVSIAILVAGEHFIGVLDGRFNTGKIPPLLHRLILTLRQWSRPLPPQFKDGYMGTAKTFPEIGHLAATLGVIASTIAYFGLGGYSLPPLCCLALLATAFVWLLSGLAFFLQVFRIPAILPVAIWLYLASSNEKADHFYPVHPASTTAPSPDQFLARYPADQPMLVVTAAGGGIQAAAWTARVLAGLQTECDKASLDFPESISLVSGVSGGSVGLMFYLGTRFEAKPDATPAFIASRQSSLSQVTKALAYEDLCRAFLPFLLEDKYKYADRGLALQKAWLTNAATFGPAGYGDDLERATLRSWGAAAVSRKFPAVILNSTIVEEGKRLAFSTIPLPTPSPGLSADPDGFEEFSTLYPGHDIHIATAARLSSAFTFVSPAARPNGPGLMPPKNSNPNDETEKPGPEVLHLVDGGYLDNSGINGLVEWLRQTIDKLESSKVKLPHDIMLIEISSFPDIPEAYRKEQRGTFFQIWAPLLTLFTVRSTGHEAAAQRELALFEEYCHCKGINFGWKIFKFKGINKADPKAGPQTPPLSWHLTQEQQQTIDDNWDAILPDAQDVVKFLRDRILPINH
jgi:hypothetical protein